MFNEVFFYRRPHPGREPRRRRQRRLVAGEGHARQRTGVAVVRRRCSGAWGRPRSTSSTVVRAEGGCDDPLLRQRLAALHTEATLLDLIRLRTVCGADQGRAAGRRGVDPQDPRRRARPARHGPRQGPRPGRAGCSTAEDEWGYGFLFAPALTVGGGTGEVQRNIVAERVLGLPHDVDVEADRVGPARRRWRPRLRRQQLAARFRGRWPPRRVAPRRHLPQEGEGRRRRRLPGHPGRHPGQGHLRRRLRLDPLLGPLRERPDEGLDQPLEAGPARRVGRDPRAPRPRRGRRRPGGRRAEAAPAEAAAPLSTAKVPTAAPLRRPRPRLPARAIQGPPRSPRQGKRSSRCSSRCSWRYTGRVQGIGPAGRRPRAGRPRPRVGGRGLRLRRREPHGLPGGTVPSGSRSAPGSSRSTRGRRRCSP